METEAISQMKKKQENWCILYTSEDEEEITYYDFDRVKEKAALANVDAAAAAVCPYVCTLQHHYACKCPRKSVPQSIESYAAAE